MTTLLTGSSRKTELPNRIAISRMIMQLFTQWAINTQEQLDLLGLARNNRTTLVSYRNGRPISENRDSLERAGHLLAIHKNLRLLFSDDKRLESQWLKTRNRAFDGLTPIELVGEFGFVGLLMVRGYLDRMCGY